MRNERALNAHDSSVRQLLAETDKASAAVARAAQKPLVEEGAAGPSTVEYLVYRRRRPQRLRRLPRAVAASGFCLASGCGFYAAGCTGWRTHAGAAQPPVIRYPWPPAIDPAAAAPPRPENTLRDTLARQQLFQTRLLELRDDPAGGPDDLLAALRDKGPIRSAPVDSAPGLPFALATSPAARDAQLDAFHSEHIANENQLRDAAQTGLPGRAPRPLCAPAAARPSRRCRSTSRRRSPSTYRPTGDAQVDTLHAERANIPTQLQVARRMQLGLLKRPQGQHNVLAARAALLAPSLRPAPPGFIRVHEPPRRHNGDTVVAPANGDAVDAPVNGEVLDAGAAPPPLEQVAPTPHRRRWVCPAPKGGLSLRAWIEEREQAVAEGAQADGSSSGFTLEVPRPREG